MKRCDANRLIWVTTACAILGGCATAQEPAGFDVTWDGGASDGGAISSGTSGDPRGGVGGGEGAPSLSDGGALPSGDGCTREAEHVYVISSDRDLYSFWPPTLAFTKIGTLSCDPASGPFSMAVDRQGTAWVLYKDGHLFRVSTKDATCTQTSFDAAAQGIDHFGMGFSTNANGATDETLFVESFSGLGRLDLKTMTVTMIGAISGPAAGTFGELTGTGDGRLYGFFYGLPASLNEVDKASAKVSAPEKTGSLSTGSAFAFSFWGGDFFLYTADATDTARPFSDVTRFRPSDATVTTVKTQVGFRIVGAGVSTCAPVQIPK